MEALVPAFIAALLCQATDRAAWLSAILADRYRRPLMVALVALVVNIVGNGAAALGALLIAPTLAPVPLSLLLALALGVAGVDGLRPLRLPDRFDGWRLGPLLTPLIGLAMLVSGDRTQFLTFAFAARTGTPWQAAAGAIAGAFVVHVASAYAGERAWRRLPLRSLRIVAAAIALIAAGVVALAAFDLI